MDRARGIAEIQAANAEMQNATRRIIARLTTVQLAWQNSADPELRDAARSLEPLLRRYAELLPQPSKPPQPN